MSDAFPLIRKQIQLLKKINYEEFVESYKNSINNPWKDNFNKLKRNLDVNPNFLPSIDEDKHFYYILLPNKNP